MSGGGPSGHPHHPSCSPPTPACRCSSLGSASAQCHENSTCVCKPGFVGYKCDRCQDNFFLTAGGAQCQECPSCYGLVKEEVSPPAQAPPTPHPGPAQAHSTFSASPASTSSVLWHQGLPIHP